MVRSPAWDGDWGLSATFRYPSGGFHAAWDVRTPVGTPVRAIRDGFVIDQNNGVRENPPGVNPGSGAPSNYVLLGFLYKGRPASLYYQHLHDTVVRDGQKVEAGELLGHTGNTGNSTGPHLHLSAQWGHGSFRYLYLTSARARIYPPSLTWLHLPPQWPGSERMSQAVAGKEFEFVSDIKKALRVHGYRVDNPGSDRLGPSALRAIKEFKKDHHGSCKDPDTALLGRDCWGKLMAVLT